MTPPRNVPDWDSFYMGLAYQYAGRSKDPHTQMGSVVVDSNYIPLGFGCNGVPRQMKDADVDWSRGKKYSLIRHAEDNAIDHCYRYIGVNGLDDCIVYVTGHPCSRCATRMVGRGVKRVCYGPQTYASGNDEELKEAARNAELGGMELCPFKGDLSWVVERMKFMDSLGLI